MKRQNALSMKRLCLFLCLLIVPALAALPPLSRSELKSQADHIWVCRVHNVKSKTVDVENGSDLHYELNVRIDKNEKGSLRPGLTVKLECRQTAERPEGWAGPQGQNEIPAEDSDVRVFVRESEGRFWLLEPNGWEPAR